MAIKAVTFDVGGTLLFPQPSVARTFVDAAAEWGYRIPVEEAEAHIPACWALYFDEYERDGDFWCTHEGCKRIWVLQYRLLCDLCGVRAHKDEIVEAVYAAFLRGHHWGVFPDVVPALEAIASVGVRMAVVSNWDADLLNILDDLRLSRYFDVRLPSGLVGLRKPNPAFFAHALACLGCGADEVLHVGDMDDADGDGPLALGIRSLIIEREGRAHDPRFAVIDDLRQVVEHLK